MLLIPKVIFFLNWILDQQFRSGKLQSNGCANGTISSKKPDGEKITNGHCNGVSKTAQIKQQNATANGCSAAEYYAKAEDLTTTNITQRKVTAEQ